MKQINDAGSRGRDWVVNRVRQVVAAGNTRSVVVKRRSNVVVEIPLTTSVAGILSAVLFIPELTAVAAIVALLAGCTLEIVPAHSPQTERGG